MAENPSTTNPPREWAEVFDAQKSVIERLRPPASVLKAAKKLNGYVGYYHGCHADINLVTGWLLSLPAALTEQSNG